MSFSDIIDKKRRGQALTYEEMALFIRGVTTGEVPDYQASALLMAICFQQLNEEETVFMTRLMADSGDRLDLSRFGQRSVDKHSTGGVGDKTTLIVAPIAAACGATVAKMSGRGLGYTGGTVDKLSSIPGYRTDLDIPQFLKQAEEIGIAVVGQSGNLTPADKKLYALRDVTATVDNIALITSSIMSKKLAAGARNIVLDVKVGSGAFMKTPAEARQLADWMVRIGKACGRRVTAVLSDMDAPLGKAIGNALEVREAADVLQGRVGGNLRELCLTLAAEMLALSLDLPVLQARERAEQALNSGAAFEKMRQWVRAQGGDDRVLTCPQLLPTAAAVLQVKSPCDGTISAVNAEVLGRTCVLLGAGRQRKEDDIDVSAGILLSKSRGEAVTAGQVLCTLYTNRPEALIEAQSLCLSAFTIGQPAPEPPLVVEIIRG